jgi:hypothetical protein
VRSHAVAVPSHLAGDLGGGGCGSAAVAHGSQASRRDWGVVAVPMIGGGEALRTRRIHARACGREGAQGCEHSGGEGRRHGVEGVRCLDGYWGEGWGC